MAPTPTLSPAAEAAWKAAVAELLPRITAASRQSFLDPVSVVGELDGCLVVEADQRTAYWLRHRYGLTLGNAVRLRSDFHGLRIKDRA